MIDLDRLRTWIGRSETHADHLTPRLAQAFEATLDLPPRAFAPGEPAPLGIHWCLGNPALPASALGRDGHPRREGFMPPIPLPRRMWASGELSFAAPLMVGEVEKVSTVAEIDFKEGRTGPLLFLTLEHRYVQEGTARVVERQILVYREDPKPDAPAGEPPRADPGGTAVRTLVPDPVLLFRYSALTFNGHRIHYDQAYARDVEGYPGLVVHGPLVATLLLREAAQGADPASFSFRGLSPLVVGEPLSIVLGCRDGAVRAQATSGARAVMTASLDLRFEGARELV
jgi:3-methylfumaryl-CoA hydratase